MRTKFNDIKTIFFFGLLACCAVNSSALGLQVGWDPSTETTDGAPIESVSCYRLFYGETPGNYDAFIEVAGNVTNAQVSGLEYNKTYYFSVKACMQDTESPFSEEIAWQAPEMPDTDQDGICDDWELARFSNLNKITIDSDTDGNGISDLVEFIAGTDPADPTDMPRIHISGRSISFETRIPAGTGYQNRTRLYTLQKCENLSTGVWTDVPGMQNIVAQGTTVSFELPEQSTPAFYRTQIILN